MAAWLLPAVKAILPYISAIVTAAMPVFTTRKADKDTASLLQQQIAELQAVASQNAAHIKELAEQIQKTVAALEQEASIIESMLRRTYVFCGAAIAISIIALCVSCIAFFGR